MMVLQQAQQRLLAKALYDNIAESPDELAFKRGDVIIVLEQETSGLEGWWLCSLRGKQGIAPGNRLKVITGTVASHVQSHTADLQGLTNQNAEKDWNRRSWDGSTNKVVTPHRQGDLFMYEARGGQPDYDVPPTRYPGAPGTMYIGSNHSSREDLLDTSASSFEHSFYVTPPQNRSLRSQDFSLYDTPPSHLSLDAYDMTPGSVRTSLSSKFSDEAMSLSSGMSKSNPPSMCDSARSSMDISPMDMYDVPPSQREREAREAKAALYPIRSSKDSGLDMYDSPPKMKSPPSMLEDYDVPKLAVINSERDSQLRSLKIPHSEPSSPGAFLDDYDVPKSSFSAHLSKGNSADELKPKDSQSDVDYDVPKSKPLPLTGKPPIAAKAKRFKSNSIGSILDDYDTPQSHGEKNFTKDDLFAKYTGKSIEMTDDADGHDYDDPDPQNDEADVKNGGARPKLERQDNAVDDLYDTPRNNAPVKNMTKEFSALSIRQGSEPRGVYDIPPQVTRDSVDSVISSKSDSTDSNEESNRLSTCSDDSRDADIPIYDELPLDLDAANDLIIKLQQDVQKSVNKMNSFVHSSWRKKDNFESKLYEINQACNAVEHSLGEFVEFGQGTLANSAKLSDRKLINKLSKYLIPLQQALQKIRVSIKHLDDVDWRVSKTGGDSQKKDDLGIITSLTKDLIGDVKKLTVFIQGNSSLLFKRAKDFKRGSKGLEHSTPTSAGKLPVGQKPALPAKLNLQSPSSSVQARPLPAPPPTERPLPPTPTGKKSQELGSSGSVDFPRKRNSGEFKHWSGEIQVKRLSVDRNSEADKSSYKREDLVQEYDYVELEDDENEVKQKVTKADKVEDFQVPEMKVNDSYEKEMEKTLDEIDGVNIYSDETGGTLKRDHKMKDLDSSDTEHDSGTLKRKNEVDSEDTCIEDSGTLKRQDYDKTEGFENECQNTDKITVSGNVNEIPEHDTEPGQVNSLDFEDKQVLAFYFEQLETHSTLLTNSIDAFFSCIESNQAPKVFISHSKFVVVSAHKLVYIGDSIHRNLKHELVRNKIIQCANNLCDCLKQTVTATKTAALQYPSVPAVQEMVDRVVDVSHAAHNLKNLVFQASRL